MLKTVLAAVAFIGYFLFTVSASASPNSFVSVVNPIRGNDFWSLQESPVEAVKGQESIIREKNIPATWLIRFDALKEKEVIDLLKAIPQNQEKGLLLEVTPTWTTAAQVSYRQSASWHLAESVFLTGYIPSDRIKLIDASFEEFKRLFGYYPKSVGAWYIDSYSLDYLQKKYKVTGAMIVSDQYNTDNYQIWGQYWSGPFYPSKSNTLLPAQDIDSKLPIVITQWAPRDPVNGYGDGVQESTYSVQANDYLDYHELSSDYFSKLVDIYTNQKFNQVNQIVVGLENSYSWTKYQKEYRNQIEILSKKQLSGQLRILTLADFADWYQSHFPDVSPPQILIAKDPLGTDKQSVWFMNPYYRTGWFYNRDGSVIRDLRSYVDSRPEFCYSSPCDKLNFATFALQSIDEVTNKVKLVLDSGNIKDIQVNKKNGEFTLSYINEVGKEREVVFLSRDISIDNKVSSIDTLILQTVTAQKNQTDKINLNSKIIDQYKENVLGMAIKIVAFLIFLVTALLIPGFLLVRFLKQQQLLLNIFLSVCTGIVILTLSVFIGGYLKFSWLPFLYIIPSVGVFFWGRIYQQLKFNLHSFSLSTFILVLLILLGTLFQSLSLIRSGWVYDFGIGFWGPLGHDGVWHQALINQLIKQVPPQNPAFSGEILSNYHYFYDLLVAVSFQISQVPVLDLIYRFFPVLFSILLGLGTYLLVNKLLNSKIVSLISLYFVYFAGSFGWIVEFIREKHFGGESAFWMNQPVSLNLNPPFAISLVLIIAIILFFIISVPKKQRVSYVLLPLMIGSLIEFKVYAGVIVLGGLLIMSFQQIISGKGSYIFKLFILSTSVALAVFLPQNSKSGELLIFSPFWFIHSMVDFPDRVGWLKLSSARQAYFERGDLLKYFLAEALGLIIFIFGNLGMRLIALFTLPGLIKQKSEEKFGFLLIFWMALISFIIPLIFIQKGNPWNTIQFSYYFLYFVAIFSGLVVWFIYRKLPRLLGYLIITLILIITPINAFMTFQSGFFGPPSRLSGGELDALMFLKKQPDGVVLTSPFNKNLRAKFDDPFPLLVYETSSYVSAFSAKATFMEDEIQQEIFQNDYQKRLVGAREFFQGRDNQWSKEFLKQNNIRYIYLPRLIKAYLSPEDLSLKNIYNNEEVEIFQVLN